MSRLCKFGFHKWCRWSTDLSVIDDRYFVARARQCKRCGLADIEQGYVANAKPQPTEVKDED